MAFSVKKYNAILNDMLNWIIANQDKITDFNEGSVISSIIEAFSIIMEELYIRTRVGYDTNLKNVTYNNFNFVRESSAKAAGNVIFSRAGTSGDVDIPIGTIIGTSSGIKFTTTAVGSITNGNTDSGSVSIEALEGGADFNVPASTITVIYTPIVGVDTVNNSAGTTGGQDEETDAQLLLRFQTYIGGLGQSNKEGLKTGALTVTGVRSASIVEHFPPVSTYNATVYIDDGAGNASQALLDNVETTLIGDDTSDNPGYKAAGINIEIKAPTKVTVDVTLQITSDGSLAHSVITYNVDQAIETYINNLGIGEDVILNELRSVIMAVDGVYDISISVPTGNTSIGSDQIARSGTITITYL